MKTATKSIFTKEQIAGLVARHFPDAVITAIISLPGGTFNTVYLIEGKRELSGGIILKIGPAEGVVVPDHEKNIMRTEVYAYQMLQDKEMPVPKIYAFDFSHALIPCDYFFMERMWGKTWFDQWPIRDPHLMRQLGRYTAKMHSVEAGWFGYIGGAAEGRFDSWGEAFLFMVNEALEEVRIQGLKLPFDKIKSAVAARREILDTLKKPVLVNFDLWAGNVFVEKKKRYEISGIIDFERCFLGDPLASFSTALLLYDNVEKEKDFLEGYNSERGTELAITELDREKMLLYEMLLYLRSFAESHRYGFWFRTVQRMGIRIVLADLLGRLRRLAGRRQKRTLREEKTKQKKRNIEGRHAESL